MTPIRWLRSLWRTLTRSTQLDRDLRDEIRAYVDLEAAEAEARGEHGVDARRRALASIGGMALVEESVRARRTGAWIGDAWQDARYGLRVLGRAPAFASSVVLTLALGIGATAAMAVAVRAVVLAPLPYPEPDRLIVLTDQGYAGEYLQYRARARTFDAAAWAAIMPVTLTGHGEPVRLETVRATTGLFDVIGVPPALGTGWREADSVPGAEPIVMLSDRLWRERFGADPGVIGRAIALDGEPRRVRGVMPADFAFPDASTDVWMPLVVDAADRVAIWSEGGTLIGRLTPGASLADATAEVRSLAPSFASLFPWRMPPGYGETASAVSLHDEVVGSTGVMLLAALAAVVFVLLTACLNVSVLLMGRAIARRGEMATRAALGASGARLSRQALVECVVLAGLGGLLALGVAAGGIAALTRALPPDMPRLHELSADGWLVAVVAALTACTGLAIGLVPVWRAARPGPAPAPGGRHAGGDRAARAATRGLVALEVAVAVVLVAGAGMLVRSLDRLLDVNPGFAPEGVISATVTPPLHRYADAPARRAFFDDVVARAEAIPQVGSAALTDRLPFASPPWGSVFTIEGRPDPARESGEWPWADYRAVVSAEYFETMGVPVTTGRPFTTADHATAGRVALVSESLANQYWPGESPVGRRIRFPGMAPGDWIAIVGTAGDVKWERLSEEPATALYLPLAQTDADSMSLVVRTNGETAAVSGALRDAVRSLDEDTPVDRIASTAALVRSSARASQFLAAVFAGFAIVGLLLGGLGIYGVSSDAVARRGHEIAVRVAIGAEATSIVRLVVRQSLTVAAIGVAAGVVAALAGGRLMSSLLFGVTATDPVAFAGAAMALLAVVVVSCAVPARRATKISPLAALRET